MCIVHEVGMHFQANPHISQYHSPLRALTKFGDTPIPMCYLIELIIHALIHPLRILSPERLLCLLLYQTRTLIRRFRVVIEPSRLARHPAKLFFDKLRDSRGDNRIGRFSWYSVWIGGLSEAIA